MGNDSQNSFQVASGNAQSADPSTVVADLQRDMLDNFSEIEAITLSKLDADKEIYYASVLLKGKDNIKRRRDIADRLISRFVDRHHALLLPVFLDSQEWDEYGRDIPCQRLFDPWSRFELADRRFNRLKESPDYPVSIRRWCLSTIRRYIAALDSVLSDESIPSEIALTACLEMLRNVLALLFASKGGVFSHDPDTIVFFRDRFINTDSCFSQSDLILYFQLLALKQQSLYFQAESTGNHRREFENLINPLANFFKKFKRYIKITYTSESEKRFRRRLAFRLIVGVLSTIAFIVLAYFAVSFFTIKNSVRLDGKKSGGIVGEYYKGKDFDNRILSRVDTQIDFFSKGRLEPRLPKDRFSARWNGYIKISDSGKRRICLEHDDGCRLFFYDELVIDEWKRGGSRKSCATVNARKGWHPIKIEYFEDKGKAKLRLLQGLNKDEVKVVASRDLCCLE